MSGAYSLNNLNGGVTISMPGITPNLVTFTGFIPMGDRIAVVSLLEDMNSQTYFAWVTTIINTTLPMMLTPCGYCRPNGDNCTMNVCLPRGFYSEQLWLASANDFQLNPVSSTRLATWNGTVSIVPSCYAGAGTTRGCVTLTVPSRVYLPLNTEQNFTFPVTALECTGSAYIKVNLRLSSPVDTIITYTPFCGSYLSAAFSCSNPPANVTYTKLASDNCAYPQGNGFAFWDVFLFEKTFYDTFNQSAYPWDKHYYANYILTYQFDTTSFPSTTVPVTPGSNTSVSLGNSTVTVPPGVLGNQSGSLFVEVQEPQSGSATNVISVEMQLSNGSTYEVRNLSQALTVAFPLLPDQHCKVPTCHFWDVAEQAWSTAGCETLTDAQGARMCSCNHATDFALLLLDSTQGSCRVINPSIAPFYFYAAVYIALGVVALYFGGRVLALCRNAEIVLQHLGVFAVCVLRAFLSFYQTGVAGGVDSITITSVSAVPRLLEFALFSFIVARWGSILHFSMGTSSPFKKVLPFLIGVNVFAAAIVIYVFVEFALAPSYDAAIIGEALLAVNAILLTVGFLVYACWLSKTFSKIASKSSSSSPSSIRKAGCGAYRIVWIGYVLSFCFIAQGVFSCLALASIPRDISTVSNINETVMAIDVYNGLSWAFNIITLGCIVLLYREGVKKLTSSQDASSSIGSSRQKSERHIDLSA